MSQLSLGEICITIVYVEGCGKGFYETLQCISHTVEAIFKTTLEKVLIYRIIKSKNQVWMLGDSCQRMVMISTVYFLSQNPTMTNNKKGAEESIKKLSVRQKRALDLTVKNMVENGGKSKGKILQDAGYSQAVQKTPEKVYKSPKMQEAFIKLGIDRDMIAVKQARHFDARKIEVKDTFYTWDEYQHNPLGIKEKIEQELDEDMPGARIVRIMERSTRGGESFVSVKFSYPDYGVQDRAFDKFYKLNGDYAPVKQEHSIVEGLVSLFEDE